MYYNLTKREMATLRLTKAGQELHMTLSQIMAFAHKIYKLVKNLATPAMSPLAWSLKMAWKVAKGTYTQSNMIAMVCKQMGVINPDNIVEIATTGTTPATPAQVNYLAILKVVAPQGLSKASASLAIEAAKLGKTIKFI